jgi:PAS domain S-box-containing protein
MAKRGAGPPTRPQHKGVQLKKNNVERNRAEERLVSSERKFKAIFENANDAIFLERGDVFIDCNRKTEEIFGCPREEIIGHKPYKFSPLRQPDGSDSKKKALEKINAAVSGDPQFFEWQCKKLNGPVFDSEVSLNRIILEGETILLAIVRDVTERKKAQEELQKAAAAERNRLARDLHDAVSQTLFSTSVIAEVLPRLWERNPEEGRKGLEEVRQLTRGALAEMRTLLLELRPSTLVEAELGDLLHQLAESISGRSRMPVTVNVEGQCALPPEVKVSLYRIVQEALNNVARHAGASQANVKLLCEPGQIALSISDNGRGFDPAAVLPDSLGLGIMRERAKNIGASFTIKGRIGGSTEVMAIWKDTSKEGPA